MIHSSGEPIRFLEFQKTNLAVGEKHISNIVDVSKYSKIILAMSSTEETRIDGYWRNLSGPLDTAYLAFLDTYTPSFQIYSMHLAVNARYFQYEVTNLDASNSSNVTITCYGIKLQ